MKKSVKEVLIELGITPNLSGFRYICMAIELISTSKENVRVIDGLYTKIAEEFNTTIGGVERAIRYAVSKINRDSEAYKKYIGVNGKANSTILHMLAIRLEEN